MLSRVVLYVSVISICSDAVSGQIDKLLTQYKTSGYFPGPVLHSVRLSVMFQCYELCGYFPRCVSISWNPGRRECHLHNTTGTVLPDQNWVYIDTVTRNGNTGCSSSTCPGKLCIPLSARGHLCVASLPGDQHRPSTSVTMTSTTGTLTGYTSTSTVIALMATTGSVLPSKTTALTSTIASTDTQLTPVSDGTEQGSLGQTTPPYNPEPMTAGVIEGSFSSFVMGAITVSATNVVSQVTDSENVIDTPYFVFVTNSDVFSDEKAVAIVTSSRAAVVMATSHPVQDVHTTNETVPDYSQEAKKQRNKLLLKNRRLRKCRNTFLLPFNETSTCGTKHMVQRNGGSCSCKTGLHFNPNRNSCVKRCQVYGTDMLYQSRLFCISGHNDRVIRGDNVQKCKKACIAETSFVCRSFDFWNGNCFLSRDTRADVRREWQPYCNCKYYQRTCAK